MVSFKIDAAVARMIDKVIYRAERSLPDDFNRMEMSMDLTACHANGCPMDWAALLEAHEFDFLHDVLGIRRHIDRNTGQLTDCFVPRFALKQ